MGLFSCILYVNHEISVKYYHAVIVISYSFFSVDVTTISSVYLEPSYTRLFRSTGILSSLFQATSELPYVLCNAIYSFSFYFLMAFVFLLGNLFFSSTEILCTKIVWFLEYTWLDTRNYLAVMTTTITATQTQECNTRTYLRILDFSVIVQCILGIYTVSSSSLNPFCFLCFVEFLLL